MSPKTLVLILILILLGAAAGFYIFPQKEKKDSSIPSLAEYKSGNLVVKSQLSRDKMEEIANFAKASLKESLLPNELVLRPATKSEQTQGDEYYASWNKDGTFVQFLYVEHSQNKTPMYLRAWTLPLGNSITQDSAQQFSSETFSESYLSNTGTLSCKEYDIEGKTITECSAMKTLENNALQGITVRTPIEAAGQQTAIMVSACLVPGEAAQFYTAPSCI